MYFTIARGEAIKEGLDLAFREGFEQGFKEGLEQGIPVGYILLSRELLKLPLTPREELLALPLAELQSRAAALEQQLGAGGQ